jgi:hypothetical protein
VTITILLFKNVQIQCDPNKNSDVVFHINRRINPKGHMEAQKNPNSQRNPEQKEQCWRYHNTTEP